jgi:hypothetical protein
VHVICCRKADCKWPFVPATRGRRHASASTHLSIICGAAEEYRRNVSEGMSCHEFPPVARSARSTLDAVAVY